MISVAEALAKVFELAVPIDVEDVPLRNAVGRVLRAPAIATRDQPPFAASAMDGYAVRAEEVSAGAVFRVIGESAAGHAFDGAVGRAEAVRIFTGAPVPNGASRVVIQEDVAVEGREIILAEKIDSSSYIRALGADFKVGDSLAAPRRLSPSDIALAAAMNVDRLTVARKPTVALIATGDELVMPGEIPDDSQIIASNTFGLAAMIERVGGDARILPIARDTVESLAAVMGLARTANLIVTIGGASVGDHDLVAQVADGVGMDRAFYKIAMRPGKPLMAGRLAGTPMIGLPGNPVSSMVCGHIFLRPMLSAMQGLPAEPLPRIRRPLIAAVSANGGREHYMRAVIDGDFVRAAERQDSALLSVLAASDALIVRPPNDPTREAGEDVDVIVL